VIGCGGMWVSRRPVDRTTTDCDDSNADMFPGQTAYFTSAHGAGASDDERFGNYNCNGTAERDHSTSVSSGACTLSPSFLRGTYYCRGTGWETSAPSCGSSGSRQDCGTKQECTSRDPRLCARGYSLVCEGRSLFRGDPCYCPLGTSCLPSCTPGTRGCAWHYYRCVGATTTETMACH